MNSLGARLIFYYSLVVTITVASALWVGFLLVKRQMISGTDFLLDSEFREIVGKLRELPAPASREAIHDAIYQHALIDASMFYFQIHNEADQILFRSPNLADRELPDLTLPSRETDSLKETRVLEGLGLMRVAEYYPGQLHVQLGTSLKFITSLNEKLFKTMIIGLPTVLLLSIAVGFVLSELTLRPFRLIERTAKRISVSNLSERIPLPKGRDELARLSVLLNDMLARLEKSFQKTKQFTAETSHELRTPLSIIRLHAEKALRNPRMEEETASELQGIIQEVQRLDQIINQLQVLAKAEALVLPLEVIFHSTAQFVEQFAEDAEALADNSSRRFELIKNEPLEVAFDRAWIRQVLFNLISNALKFSPQGSVVRFASFRDGSNWKVSLTDEGPGVPDAYREAIFEPFKQCKESGHESNGCGLGLAVCKSIVELHHGHISCGRLEAGKGFGVTFTIPIRRS